jgi:hypothetical protein
MSRITKFSFFLLMIFSNYVFGSTASQLVGKWNCEQYVMKTDIYNVTVNEYPVYEANGNFFEISEATIEYPNGFSFTFETKLTGTWVLNNKVLDIKFKQAEFLSSDNPQITNQKGQKIADDQFNKKNWAKSEVTFIGEKFKYKPIDPMYKEANMVVTCGKAKRTTMASIVYLEKSSPPL